MREPRAIQNLPRMMNTRRTSHDVFVPAQALHQICFFIAARAFWIWMGAGEQVVGLVYDETAATLEYWLDGKYQGCVFSNLPPGISLQVFRKCALHSVC